MAHSPTHLTPMTVLPLAQKLYYYLLCADFGHDPRKNGERFKIWPVAFDMTLTALVQDKDGLRGEMEEVSRRETAVSSGTLYKGVRAMRVQGRLTIAASFNIDITCMVYDLLNYRSDA
jgi:hypothetical protein